MTGESTGVQIDAYFDDLAIIEDALQLGENRLPAPVLIETGITLTPLFISIRSSRAVGSAEALAFLVTVSSSVAAKTLADVVYKWFKKTKANRLRIDRTEMSMSRPDEVIRIVREIIDKETTQ